ncbi:hypothetical protein ACUXAV_001187 [Cupriavidus metallidurans]|jgi:hypothetical protein|nr:hypothetical protein AU374_01023 [Cupriavidus metallidurans]
MDKRRGIFAIDNHHGVVAARNAINFQHSTDIISVLYDAFRHNLTRVANLFVFLTLVIVGVYFENYLLQQS